MRQVALVLAVWGHLVVGIHYWLRLRAGYRRVFPLATAIAVLVPVLALLGFWGAGLELRARGDIPASATPAATTPAAAPRDTSGSDGAYGDGPPSSLVDRAQVDAARDAALLAYTGLLVLVLGARSLRAVTFSGRGAYRIQHANGRTLPAGAGQSVLEAVRAAGIAHAAVCGGRARCTTCRVRVRSVQPLPAPAAVEAEALQRIHAPPDVRLACQLRPHHDVAVMPLLPPHVGPEDVQRAGHPGREHPVAVMFVDIRESSRLGERRLPYDVFFILNRFFAEMAEALRATGGYYSTFNGDGFMALYGTAGDLGQGCRDAMRGAVAIHDRLARINAALAADLVEPLRAGVSIHAGEAIVGTMGPPDHPVLSALGDTVNVAARLESETKRHRSMLVISAACGAAAGIDLAEFPRHTAAVRGRDQPVTYFVIDDPRALVRLLADRAPGTAG